MKKKINCIMLIDDNPHDIFFNSWTIKKNGKVQSIVSEYNGLKAIEYLSKLEKENEQIPDLIFLDLNMPVLDGWGFLDQFQLQFPHFVSKIRIIILSTSNYVGDIERAKNYPFVSSFITKPLTSEQLDTIFTNYDSN